MKTWTDSTLLNIFGDILTVIPVLGLMVGDGNETHMQQFYSQQPCGWPYVVAVRQAFLPKCHLMKSITFLTEILSVTGVSPI